VNVFFEIARAYHGKEDPSLWKEILDSKYGSWRVLDEAKGSKLESWWWRDIKNLCGKGQKTNWFNKNLRWNKGKGNKIKFWDDIWLDEMSLKERFPRLYTNAILKEGTLGEYGFWNGDQWQWCLPWRRSWFEWEKTMVNVLMNEIEGISLSREREDEWQWRDDKTQVYTVNSAYTKLKNDKFVQDGFSYSEFRKIKALPSAQFFAWRVIINKVATRDNLERKGIDVGSRMCVLCGTNEETINHLFFSCDVTSHVWKMCDSWVRRSSLYHMSAQIHFSQFKFLGLHTNYSNVWGCMWMAIIWGIWSHRNGVIFKNTLIDMEEVFMLAQTKAWAWITNKYPSATFSYSDWCLSPITCLLAI